VRYNIINYLSDEMGKFTTKSTSTFSAHIEEPIIIQGLLPRIPSTFTADISVTESIKIDTEAKNGLEYVWIRIDKRVQKEWHTLTTILHKLPEKFSVSAVNVGLSQTPACEFTATNKINKKNLNCISK